MHVPKKNFTPLNNYVHSVFSTAYKPNQNDMREDPSARMWLVGEEIQNKYAVVD